MRQSNTVGVDLAKNVIQVSVVTPSNKELSNKELTRLNSGGKTNLIGISRNVANRRLRAVLIQGARSYVHQHKQITSGKDEWLTALISRGGSGRAAVALANKNESYSYLDRPTMVADSQTVVGGCGNVKVT